MRRSNELSNSEFPGRTNLDFNEFVEFDEGGDLPRNLEERAIPPEVYRLAFEDQSTVLIKLIHAHDEWMHLLAMFEQDSNDWHYVCKSTFEDGKDITSILEEVEQVRNDAIPRHR